MESAKQEETVVDQLDEDQPDLTEEGYLVATEKVLTATEVNEQKKKAPSLPFVTCSKKSFFFINVEFLVWMDSPFSVEHNGEGFRILVVELEMEQMELAMDGGTCC